MDIYSLSYTALILIGVILFMTGVLYVIRWVMTKSNITLYPIKGTSFRVIDRFRIDAKRQLIRLQDTRYEYVILLGESDLLLNKTSCQSENLP